MKRLGTYLTAAALAICLAWSASAEKEQRTKQGQPGDRGPAALIRADQNGDGALSYEEVKAKLPNLSKEKFNQWDKNHDGMLQKSEISHVGMQNQPPHPEGSVFSRADSNGDGAVTWDELSAKAPKFSRNRFSALDKNGDGKLTVDELPTRPTPDTDGAKAMFQRADADANGQVTLEELKKAFPRATLEKFAALDKNGDKVLTLDEVRKAKADQAPQNVYAMARKADTDGNGQVTFDEMQKVAPSLTHDRFDRMDRNHDGVLSAADRLPSQSAGKSAQERQAGKDAARKLMETDKDGNGEVTFDEVTAAKPGFPRQAFDRFDTNKDGVLSSADYSDRPRQRAPSE